MNIMPKILLLALSASASQPALAQQKFENLDRIDSLVAMTVGANIGEPGGPMAPVDRRLHLAACPATPSVDGPTFGAAIVKCDALGCIVPGKVLVAASLRPEALDEDCVRAGVVVSAAAGIHCKGPAVVIDRKTAEEGQGWRVTLSPVPAAVSVRAARGQRPWVSNGTE